MKRFGIILLTIIMMGAVIVQSGCASKNEEPKTSADAADTSAVSEINEPESSEEDMQDVSKTSEAAAFVIPEGAQKPLVTIEMNDGQKIEIELFAEYAPNTVYNFISLAQKGYYDGMIFHRIIPDLIIQGGGVRDMSFVEPGYTIKGEFADNGFTQNTLKHTRGVISMARATEYDSGSAQFFIMQGEEPMWDGRYTGFGQVVSGIETVDSIVEYVVENGIEDNPPTIKTITVDTFGVEYPQPEVTAR